MDRKQKWQRIIYFAIVLLVIGLIVTRGEANDSNQTSQITEITEDAESAASGAASADVEGEDAGAAAESATYIAYTFRNEEALQEHYEKHGIEMGFESAEAYEKAASDVVNNPASLHKIEAEDGDDVYYLEETNDFVIVATYGAIRTYFRPEDGIAYYQRQ